MSGKPSPGGVTEFRAIVSAYNTHATEVARLSDVIRRANDDLAVAKEKLAEQRMRRNEAMAKMDLAAPGNFGYEDRLLWFIHELVRQEDM